MRVLQQRSITHSQKNDKKFLMSFVANQPDWSLVRDKKIKDYPSVQWKLLNQSKMKTDKASQYIAITNKVLYE